MRDLFDDAYERVCRFKIVDDSYFFRKTAMTKESSVVDRSWRKDVIFHFDFYATGMFNYCEKKFI